METRGMLLQAVQDIHRKLCKKYIAQVDFT